jgi:acetate kinase
MSDAILVLNAGSSSIKFSLFLELGDSLELFLGGQLESLYTAPRFKAKDAVNAVICEKTWGEGETLGHDGGIAYLADFLRAQLGEHQLVAVGHRVVHGGLDYAAPVRLTAEIVDHLEQLVPLAPLHQPHNLKPIRLLLANRPGIASGGLLRHGVSSGATGGRPGVCATGRNHRPGRPPLWFPRPFLRVHCLSFAAAGCQGRPGARCRAALGNGASMCAMQDGKSMASTMGFTAVDGLPMGTRCGSLDPGVVLYLIDELKMDTRAIEKLLYQQSGLLGVSGISSDMRTLLDSTDPKAKFAVDLFVYRVARELGSLVAALGGLDALIFTAGIGEHSAAIRERVCQAAAWLGVELDPAANADGGPRISMTQSRVPVWVIPTNEELMIARHTRRILKAIH